MTKEFDARNERKSRSVCATMAEAADTGKRVLAKREREILDMWPKFEDGEPVMIGDESTNNKNQRFTVKRIEFRHGKWMLNDSVTEGHYLNGKSGKRVKRPASKALDADGMEIKVGDTVYDVRGERFTVTDIEGGLLGLSQDGFIIGSWMPADQFSISLRDSWERLEEDAVKVVCEYAGAVPDEFGDYDCDTCHLFDARGNLICEQQMALEIVRRAKALAGVEVAE